MRIRIRTSRTAIWARRLGSLALPLVLLPVLMHHLGILQSAPFLVVFLFAGSIAAMALMVSLLALVRLWYSGDQGWSQALSGLALGLVCLLPFAWYGYLALRYPPVTDIATVPRSELPLMFEPDTALMPPPKLLDAADQQRLFPNATTRTYPLDATQLFAIVKRLVEGQGWSIRFAEEPTADGQPGRINARAVMPLGWQDEAVIRVARSGTGATVDMRSASIGAPLDFGANGTRISDFLVALDNEVTAFLRDNPTLNDDATDDETATPDAGPSSNS